MDELLPGDPAASTGPAQSRHLCAVPALRLPEGAIPGERRALLAGGAEVQGKRSKKVGVLVGHVITCR